MKPSILQLALGVSLGLSVASAIAADAPAMNPAEREQIRQIVKEVIREYAATLNDRQSGEEVRDMVRNIVKDNRKFMRGHRAGYFQPFQAEQHPRATVITCSDSRIQTPDFDATPDGDLFMVRNIGNQLGTAEGSVEFGVQHLHTPLLLIVGHVACEAIQAAASDYSQESPQIRRELDTLQIPKGEGGLSGVKLNVNNQVRQAMSKFEDEVLSGHLTVMGAVYDFRNEMKLGQGRLNIININGETDPAVLGKMEIMGSVDAPARRRAPTPGSKARKPLPPMMREKAGLPGKPPETEGQADKPAEKTGR